MQVKYQIFRLSAKSLMGYTENSGRTTFECRYKLSKPQTDKCKIYTATHEQEDNALFFQIMCQLHGENWKPFRSSQGRISGMDKKEDWR